MLVNLLFLLLVFFNLNADTQLQSAYYVQDREINSSVITHNEHDSFNILTIRDNDHIDKIKSKDLIKLLEEHGYKGYTYKNGYVNFILKSPIDTSFIEAKIVQYYKKKYKMIDIGSVFVRPRSYMSDLPEEYVVNIKNRDYLSKSATISIKTPQNKKFFFDYDIKAYVLVYESKKEIRKDTRISPLYYNKKSILLDKFRARPLQEIEALSLQAKRYIPKNKILTQRDVETLDVVRRGSIINVKLVKEGMSIIFSAKALQDAKVNDIIKVQNSNKKILKVRVTGKDMAEIE